MKHKLRKCIYVLFLIIGLSSCREEETALESKKQEKTFRLFNKESYKKSKISKESSFLSKSYALDFLQAYYSYDLKNGTNYTGLNIKSPISNSYINFLLHSQIIEDKEGNLYMYFPVMKNEKISDIYFSSINKENTILGLYKLKNTIPEYNDIFSAFERAFNHSNRNMFSRGQGVTDIEEVVITGPSNPSDDMGIIGPGQCEMYGQCNNSGGGNGSSGGSGGGGGTGGTTPTAGTADGILEVPSARELAWLLLNTSAAERDKMRDNVKKANLYANTQPGFHNGLGDALRHSLWSALDAADLGLNKAKDFHTLHETANPASDGSNAMDLHNNQWGFNWYSQNGNPDNNIDKFLYDFFAAVNSGQIQTQPNQ
ncbi:hypothetical protein [Chryseobacterium sp.]|uniref:DUF6973 domain-containing protein n=1 Tax=Chryseobacterium sp. TaxID=1871047 RepID=UPI002632C313|nr:hypothetical protein [Chryseobacterium sp.]